MSFRRPCIGAIALTLAAGCSVAPPRYSIETPTQLSTEHIDAPPEPIPDPSQTGKVSLHGMLAYADKNSPLLTVSRAELGRGDAQLRGAKPLLPADPSVQFSIGPRIGSDGTGLDVSLGLQQKLEISGARGLRIEAAERFRDVKQMELAEIRWLVHQRVHALFHQALVARDRAVAAGELLKFSESLVSIAERRLKAGDISPLGVRVAQGELAQARQAKVAADGDYRTVRISLAEVTGWPSAHLPEPAGNLDAPKKAPEIGKLVALAEEKNPRLHTNAAATRAAEAQSHLAAREAWPKPQIGVQYTRESDTAGGLGGGAEANVVLFGVGLPIPLWRKNVASRARAKAEVGVARARHQSQKQMLAARVRRAANEVDVGADRIAAYGSQILPTFEKNLTMLRRAFELGEIEILDVSVAQRRFLDIQRSALSSYQQYYQAAATLELVVGAEVWPEERHDTGESK